MSSAPVNVGQTSGRAWASSLSRTALPSNKTDDKGVDSHGVDEGLVHVAFERGYPFLQKTDNECVGGHDIDEGPVRELELRRCFLAVSFPHPQH
jgi:hypothetical protein